MDWSIILFILKWIFLGLVYLVLILLLVGVTREMRLRLPAPAPTAASTGFGRLRVVQSGDDSRMRPGMVVPLEPDTTIGAQPDNTIVLQDRYVSGHHVRLRWDGINWWVEDLNSTNGTYVNRSRVPAGGSEPISSGAMLEIGDMAFEMVE